MTTNALPTGIIQTDSFWMRGPSSSSAPRHGSLEADLGSQVTEPGVAGMGEGFIIDFIETAIGALTNVIYRKLGARAPGILLAAVAQPPKPVAEAA